MNNNNSNLKNASNSRKLKPNPSGLIFLDEKVDSSCKNNPSKSLRIIFDTLLLQKKVMQQDLADYLGVDKAYISRICNGRQIPILKIKLKIAGFFDCDTGLIWRGE